MLTSLLHVAAKTIFNGFQMDCDKAEQNATARVMQGVSRVELARMLEAELLKPNPDLSGMIGLYSDFFHGKGAFKHYVQHDLKFVTSNAMNQHAQKKICKLGGFRLMEIDDIHVLYRYISCLITFLDTADLQQQLHDVQLDQSVWVPMRIRNEIMNEGRAGSPDSDSVATGMPCQNAL